MGIEKMTLKQNFLKTESVSLYLDDSLKLMKTIETHSIDACITDPPYNISGYNGKKEIGWLNSNKYWKENKNFEKIDETWDVFKENSYNVFTKAWLDEIHRIVKPNGNIIIFGSYHNIYSIGAILEQMNLKIVNSIVWFKRNAFPNITQRMFCESTEHMIWAVNNKASKAKNWTFNYKIGKELNKKKICKKCVKVYEAEFTFCPSCGVKLNQEKFVQLRNMWDIPLTNGKEKIDGKHPAQKPLAVIKRLVLTLTKENDLIIDPFMGIGTIPLASYLLHRRAIGIERESKYCSISKKRFENEKYYERIIK
jgi:site-specific DNA-methyltransferase (adenine-specific)